MPMKMDLSIYQKQEMQMRLAPQIIQSIEILQLPTLELQQRINQEMLENPILEEEEPRDEQPEEVEELSDERTDDESEFDKMIEMEERMRDYSSQAPARPRRDERDPKLDAMQNTAAPSISLQRYLADQLTLLDLDERTNAIAENIIFNLDDNGYLQYSLEEIVESMPRGTTVAGAERVLRIVQTLDPPGVAARDLKECLLLQLAQSDGEYELPRRLITDHLHDLQMNRYPKICQETGRSMQEIREAAAFIGHLSPKPGAMFTSEQPRYVLPDVRVVEANGGYRVEMCDDYVPRLRISRNYIRMLKSKKASREEKEYVRNKLQSAKWLIDSIQQRRQTLMKIMREVVKHQREFFEKGIRFLKPLKMGVVAEAADVHVSTVSRAIADKYADTPRGLFDIKFFFAGSAHGNGADDGVSRETVQDLVRETVENEDKSDPLSDGAIVEQLKEKGIEVARRTVTKYRKELGIPASRQRIEY
ncbi:MAG: RNA polymerase factor sigma-54 [Planctomycetota bacterium]